MISPVLSYHDGICEERFYDLPAGTVNTPHEELTPKPLPAQHAPSDPSRSWSRIEPSAQRLPLLLAAEMSRRRACTIPLPTDRRGLRDGGFLLLFSSHLWCPAGAMVVATRLVMTEKRCGVPKGGRVSRPRDCGGPAERSNCWRKKWMRLLFQTLHGLSEMYCQQIEGG